MVLVLIDGRVIAHHAFAGNRNDATTVSEVLQDLRQRFGLQRIVFVGDRGIVDRTGWAVPEEAGGVYLLCLSRQQDRAVEKMLAGARRMSLEDWAIVSCPARPGSYATYPGHLAGSQDGTSAAVDSRRVRREVDPLIRMVVRVPIRNARIAPG